MHLSPLAKALQSVALKEAGAVKVRMRRTFAGAIFRKTNEGQVGLLKRCLWIGWCDSREFL